MERVRHSEIVPLEFSELSTDGRFHWERERGQELSSALLQTLNALHSGPGAMPSPAPVPARLLGFEAVFLTGGRLRDRVPIAAFRHLPFAVVIGEETVFAGERGGFELLKVQGVSGWVADLGQSRFKLSAPKHRWNFPRDSTRLRMPGNASDIEFPTQRIRLREFIALNLLTATSEANESPNALVFALPARVADDGTPSANSYPGMQGDRMLLPDALALAGLSGTRLFVLNDAELAALGARLDPRLAGYRKILVLTLGFGIGAALIHRPAARPSTRGSCAPTSVL